MLIRRAHVLDRGLSDVRIRADRIAECAPALPRLPDEPELDARGGWLLPGLHDHHIHLRALAAAAASVPIGPPAVRTATQLVAALQRAHHDLPSGQWIRAIGYHQSVAGDLDRWALDRMLPDRPLRVQHRSGALWVLNSRAIDLVGLDHCAHLGVERDVGDRPTGRLWRLDSWLSERTGAAVPDLAAMSRAAARQGVTGFTDATPDMSNKDVQVLADAVREGQVRQRVHCMAPPAVTDPTVPRFTLGPTKILLDDGTLPTLDEFVAQIRAAHAVGRPVAVHCVTRTQFVLTQVALDDAGVLDGDRIEHGAIVPAESLPWLRDTGVVVVTQPHFMVERGEQYARDVASEELPDLWRLGSLHAAGVRFAAGTDAPFGKPDPWQVVRAAVWRRSPPHTAEQISVRSALRLFLGRPGAPAVSRRTDVGHVADLVLLRLPPSKAIPELAVGAGGGLVTATFVAGTPIYLAEP